MNLTSGRFLVFVLATVPKVFTFLTEPILFLCQCKGFYIIHLDDILVLFHSECTDKWNDLFCALC